MYADSNGMLRDRVSALREANIYERQTYRHLIGLPAILGEKDGGTLAETPFLIVRIMRDGRMDLFATGRYLDTLVEEAGALKFRERLVVCDSSRIDTLLAIPPLADSRGSQTRTGWGGVVVPAAQLAEWALRECAQPAGLRFTNA